MLKSSRGSYRKTTSDFEKVKRDVLCEKRSPIGQKMQKIFTFLLFMILSFCNVVNAANPVIDKAHKATHKISIEGLNGVSGFCSGTAIGPHAILTATHCSAPAASIGIDGKTVEIVSIMSDSLDHSVYLLGDGVEFSDYASISPNYMKVEQGDEVFIFGNPGDYSDMFRKGYVSGFEKQREGSFSIEDLFNLLTGDESSEEHKAQPLVVLYDFMGFFGDSGSAIFDTDGRIIAVTSFIEGDSGNGFQVRFMGSYELRLTKDQLDKALKFVPPSYSKEKTNGSSKHNKTSKHD